MIGVSFFGFGSIVAILIVSLNAALTQNGSTVSSFVAINAFLMLYGVLGFARLALANSLSPKPRSSSI